MAADTNHHRSNNDSRESKEGHVGMGLVPSQDRAASRPLGEAREPPSALAIAMKACPGPRSGIDRPSNLSSPFEASLPSFRPPLRHWYENDATQPQECLNATAPALVSPAPASSFRRKPESRGGTNDTQDTSTNQCIQLSYLGVPATAGTSDWYESMSRTPIRDGFRHRPARVERAKCRAGACPQPCQRGRPLSTHAGSLLQW